MNIHTRKRAIFMRSVARRNDSFGADTEGFALSSQRKAQITRRNAVSAQEPKKFALSSQRKLSVLLIVGILILSAKECDMKPMGPGDGGDPEPVVAKPLRLARTVVADPGVTFATNDFFGRSIANVGDLDGDGGTVLAVGAINIDGVRGAIYLLSYDDEGALQSTKKIGHEVDETNGMAITLAPSLSTGDQFGYSIVNVGDLSGNGNTVLAVGAAGTDTGRGAVYLLPFSTSGNLASEPTKIASGIMNGPTLAATDRFAEDLANAGDLYGNKGTVLAVGAPGDDTGADAAGAIYLLSFNATGSLMETTKIASGTDNAPAGIARLDRFGVSVTNAGDLYGNKGTVLAVGAESDDAGGLTGSNRGAIYLLSFTAAGILDGTAKITHGLDETNASTNANAPILQIGELFGRSIANVGNLDGEGSTVLAVGANHASGDSGSEGGIHLLSFNASGSLASSTNIGHGTTNGPMLASNDKFGQSIANAGNLDGSGGRVLVVGATGAGSSAGEFHLLYFSPSADDE